MFKLGAAIRGNYGRMCFALVRYNNEVFMVAFIARHVVPFINTNGSGYTDSFCIKYYVSK